MCKYHKIHLYVTGIDHSGACMSFVLTKGGWYRTLINMAALHSSLYCLDQLRSMRLDLVPDDLRYGLPSLDRESVFYWVLKGDRHLYWDDNALDYSESLCVDA